MKLSLFEKGKTNWLSVVLVSALIGALTSWLIIFISDSILEISAPDSARNNGTNATITAVADPAAINSAREICSLRVIGRELDEQEKQKCAVAGGEVSCGTINTGYADQSGTNKNFCECYCSSVGPSDK